MQNVLCKYDLPCTHIIMDRNYKNLNIGNNFETIDSKKVFKHIPKLCYFKYTNLSGASSNLKVNENLEDQLMYDVKISEVYLHVHNDISANLYVKVLDYIKSFSNAKTLHCYTNSEDLNKVYREWSIENKNVLYKFNSVDNRDRCVARIIGTLKPEFIKNAM